MTIVIETEHENHKWVNVEISEYEDAQLTGISGGTEDEQALFIIFEYIEKIQLELQEAKGLLEVWAKEYNLSQWELKGDSCVLIKKIDKALTTKEPTT
ncbi:MAG: hypothetical protein V3R67_08890 [Thermodesulfobacteriota bacterium]